METSDRRYSERGPAERHRSEPAEVRIVGNQTTKGTLMEQEYDTDNGNETTPPLADQGPRDGSYEEDKNDAATSSSLEDPPDDGSTLNSSVDGADDAQGTKASGQTGNYSDAGTDAVAETVPVQD